MTVMVEEKETHITRSRTKAKANLALPRGPNRYKVWDPGRNTLKIIHYPYHESAPAKAMAAKLILPAGTVTSPSIDMIK